MTFVNPHVTFVNPHVTFENPHVTFVNPHTRSLFSMFCVNFFPARELLFVDETRFRQVLTEDVVTNHGESVDSGLQIEVL